MALRDLVWARAVQKGFFGTSRFWTVVVIVMGARKVLRRFTGDAPKTVFSHKLEPGEAFVITHLRADAKMEG